MTKMVSEREEVEMRQSLTSRARTWLHHMCFAGDDALA